jgi:photosystem II stability/assembly factor-like uncharacterized protein
MSNDLEHLYQAAKAALAAKDYDRARDRLQQILKADTDYKDAAQLLARVNQLSRRRWYNDFRLWGSIGILLLIGLGICFLPLLQERTGQTEFPSIIPPTETRVPIMAASATSTGTAAFPPTATAVPFTWKQVPTGQEFERDTVIAIAIDPKDLETLYVGMKHAGIYKSTDGGLAWYPAHLGLSNTHINSLKIDPQNPQILYAGTMGGIFQSEDGGENWTRIGEGTHLLMDPQASSHLYARDGDTIYETTDQGKSWKTVYSTQEGCPDKIHTWAIHPVEGKTLFIVGGEECEPGLYLSGDDGKTWTLEEKEEFCTEELSIGLDRQGKYHVVDYCGGEYAFLIPLPTFDQLYSYWGNDSRLFKEGLNGEQRLTLGRPDVGFVTVLAISSDDPDTIYAGGKGMSVSTDRGLTWTKLNNGLGSEILYLDTGSGNTSVLYLQAGECEDVQRVQQKKYYLGAFLDDARQPLYISANGGQTWDLSLQNGCYLAKDANEAILYRVGQDDVWSVEADHLLGWIWLSKDQGKIWKGVYITDIGNSFTLVAHPLQSGVLFAYSAQTFSGLGYGGEKKYISENYGKSWTKTDATRKDLKLCYGSTLQIIDAYRPMAIDPQDGNHVFVIDNGTLLESHDSCETTSAFVTAPNTSMNSIAFDLNTPNILYAGTDEGAYVSFDSGQSWNQINDGLLGTTAVYSIVVDKNSNVYAGTPFGIFELESK